MGTLTTAVLRAIADAKGVTVDELDLILYEYIDPDTLAQLEAHDGSSWTLSFELPEHTVSVSSDGVVTVDDSHQQMRA